MKTNKGSINLYNIDCMEFMRSIPDNYYDLAIVDPPYGNDDAIDLKDTVNAIGKTHTHYAKRPKYESFENIEPDNDYFIELKRISKNRIIWGFNYLTNLYERSGVLVWNKNGTAFGQAELALCTMFKSVRIYELTWNGFLKYDGADNFKRIHNTEKPTRLYEYLFSEFAKPGFKILDTHGGSMTIAIAADRMNRMNGLDLHLDVTEVNPKIYKLATERFLKVTAQQSIFDL